MYNKLTPFGSAQAYEENCVILYLQSSYITTLLLLSKEASST